MSYTPPDHDDLSLNFTSNYTPPDYDDLSLNFGAQVDGQAFVAILTDSNTLSAGLDFSVLKIKSTLVDTDGLSCKLAIFAKYAAIKLDDTPVLRAGLAYQKLTISVALSDYSSLYPKLKDFAQYVAVNLAAPANYGDAYLTIRALKIATRFTDNSDSLQPALDYNALPIKSRFTDSVIFKARMQPLYTPLRAVFSDAPVLKPTLKRYAFGSVYSDYAVFNTALSLARGKISAYFGDKSSYQDVKLRFYAFGSRYIDVDALYPALVKTAFNFNATLADSNKFTCKIGFLALGIKFNEQGSGDSLKSFLKYDYPPFFESTPATAAVFPYQYRYIAAARDREGIATIALLSVPSWLSFDSSTNTLSGVPPPPMDAEPLYVVILKVTDNIGQFVTQEWGISVMSVYENPPPAPVVYQWLRQNRKGKVITLHVRGYNFTQSSEQDFYFASEPFTSRPTDTPPNRAFLELILDVPVFESVVNVDFSGAEATWGMVSLFNNQLDDLLTGYSFDLRSLVLKVGDREWPYNDFYTLFAGVVGSSGLSSDGIDKLNVALRNNSSLLQKPLLDARYPEYLADGVTPHPAANELIPEVWGGTTLYPVFNVKPVLINPAAHTYQIHNGKIYDIVEVRDVGLPVSFTKDLEGGTFTLTQGGATEVRCDVVGMMTYWDTAFVTPDRPAELCLALARRAGIADEQMNLDSFAILNASDDVPCGFAVRDDAKIIDLMKQVLNSCNSIHEFDPDGKLVVRKLVAPPQAYEDENQVYAPIFTVGDDDLDQDGIQPVEILPPFTKVTLKYKKNWDTLTTVAGQVSEETPEFKQLLEKEFSEVVSLNAGSVSNYLSAQPAEASQTLLIRQADAQYYADIRMDLRSEPRMIADLRIISDVGSAMRCADHIGFNTSDNRFNCNNKRWVVVRVSQNPLDGATDVRVLEMSNGTS